jgi:hypothetical protein
MESEQDRCPFEGVVDQCTSEEALSKGLAFKEGEDYVLSLICKYLTSLYSKVDVKNEINWNKVRLAIIALIKRGWGSMGSKMAEGMRETYSLLSHSINVAFTSFEVCRALNLGECDMAFAVGLLHDFNKYVKQGGEGVDPNGLIEEVSGIFALDPKRVESYIVNLAATIPVVPAPVDHVVQSVKVADVLSSLISIEEIYSAGARSKRYADAFKWISSKGINFFAVGIPSRDSAPIVSSLISFAVAKSLASKGGVPLLALRDGVIFMTKGQKPPLTAEEVEGEFMKALKCIMSIIIEVRPEAFVSNRPGLIKKTDSPKKPFSTVGERPLFLKLLPDVDLLDKVINSLNTKPTLSARQKEWERFLTTVVGTYAWIYKEVMEEFGSGEEIDIRKAYNEVQLLLDQKVNEGSETVLKEIHDEAKFKENLMQIFLNKIKNEIPNREPGYLKYIRQEIRDAIGEIDYEDFQVRLETPSHKEKVCPYCGFRTSTLDKAEASIMDGRTVKSFSNWNRANTPLGTKEICPICTLESFLERSLRIDTPKMLVVPSPSIAVRAVPFILATFFSTRREVQRAMEITDSLGDVISNQDPNQSGSNSILAGLNQALEAVLRLEVGEEELRDLGNLVSVYYMFFPNPLTFPLIARRNDESDKNFVIRNLLIPTLITYTTGYKTAVVREELDEVRNEGVIETPIVTFKVGEEGKAVSMAGFITLMGAAVRKFNKKEAKNFYVRVFEDLEWYGTAVGAARTVAKQLENSQLRKLYKFAFGQGTWVSILDSKFQGKEALDQLIESLEKHAWASNPTSRYSFTSPFDTLVKRLIQHRNVELAVSSAVSDVMREKKVWTKEDLDELVKSMEGVAELLDSKLNGEFGGNMGKFMRYVNGLRDYIYVHRYLKYLGRVSESQKEQKKEAGVPPQGEIS